MKTRRLAAMFCFLLSTFAGGGDWPRFRGPNGTGIAPDTGAPTAWSDTKNLQWKTALPGPGSSSPIVSGERVFVTCYSGYGDGSAEGAMENLKRHLVCLDRQTGKILWDSVVAAEMPEDAYSGFLTEHGYASSTPATDGKRVYVFFGKTGALAFDLDGKQLWKVNLGRQSSGRRWGSAASPIVLGDRVIVNAAEEGRAVFALDAATGKEIWKADADTLELCYGTPVVMEQGGRTDLMIAVPGELWAMNPDTGKLRWFAETGIGGNVSPSAVVDGSVAFVTGGYPQMGTTAIRGGGKGDVTATNVLWSSRTASYVPSPVVCNGNLYYVSDKGAATCVDAKTGNVVRSEKIQAIAGGGKPAVYASPILIGGKIYAVSRRNGTFVLEATPQMALVSQNTFGGDTSDFNATPAVSGKQLFLRSNCFMYCVRTDAGG
jgi:outer membrane protein assembly factor BamB